MTKTLTPAELARLAAQAARGATDLERRMAASLLLSAGYHVEPVAPPQPAQPPKPAKQALARVIPFPTPKTTPTPQTTTADGGSMQFTKATKRKARLRMTLEGPSGSGKTYSALEAGTVLGGRIALVDTEHGSASKYADRFSFDSVELDTFDIKNYLKAIAAAAAAGYDVLIIDSLSHAWMGKGGALELVDKLTAASRSKNAFTDAWRHVTPLHTELIEAMLAYPGHLLTTMRVKTAYDLEKDDRGRTMPKKVGLAPVQREGMEYEFDVVADLTPEGNLLISKTRCPDLSGQAGLLKREDIRSVAEKLKAWLSDGVDAPPAPKPPPAPSSVSSSEAEREPWDEPSSEGKSTQPTPVQQVLADIAAATTLAQLDALAGRIAKLSASEKDVVRKPWVARKAAIAKSKEDAHAPA